MRSVRLLVGTAILLVIAVGAHGVLVNGFQLYGALSGNWSGDGTRATTARTKSRAAPLTQTTSGARQLAFDGTALILAFDPDCSVCGDNMPRWLDVLERVRRESLDVRIYALSLDSSHAEALRYWQLLEHQVEVLTLLQTTDAPADLQVSFTPTTLVLRDGHVVGEYLGVLGQRRINSLIDQLR